MHDLLSPVELPAEGWSSGRWRSPRKRVSASADRGFESRSLRQNVLGRIDPLSSGIDGVRK